MNAGQWFFLAMSLCLWEGGNWCSSPLSASHMFPDSRPSLHLPQGGKCTLNTNTPCSPVDEYPLGHWRPRPIVTHNVAREGLCQPHPFLPRRLLTWALSGPGGWDPVSCGSLHRLNPAPAWDAEGQWGRGWTRQSNAAQGTAPGAATSFILFIYLFVQSTTLFYSSKPHSYLHSFTHKIEPEKGFLLARKVKERAVLTNLHYNCDSSTSIPGSHHFGSETFGCPSARYYPCFLISWHSLPCIMKAEYIRFSPCQALLKFRVGLCDTSLEFC